MTDEQLAQRQNYAVFKGHNTKILLFYHLHRFYAFKALLKY